MIKSILNIKFAHGFCALLFPVFVQGCTSTQLVTNKTQDNVQGREPAASPDSCKQSLSLFLSIRGLEKPLVSTKGKVAVGSLSVVGASVATAKLMTEPTDEISKNWRDFYAHEFNKGRGEAEIRAGVPHLALVGDSLSTNFYLGNGVKTVWRMWTENGQDLFIDRDPSPSSIYSYFERISRIKPVYVKNYARPAATVYRSRSTRGPVLNTVANIQPMGEQVENILAEKRFPDLIMLWIGHNNMDWAGGYGERELDSKAKRDAILKEVRHDFMTSYEIQVKRLLSRATKKSEKTAIVVFGIGNFRDYFRVREHAETLNKSNPKLFPYLKVSSDHLISIKPEYRQELLDLVDVLNEDLREMVDRLVPEFGSHDQIQLTYSDELARTESNIEWLSEVDAWHPNARGHSQLAKLLHLGSMDALRFIGIEK